MRGTPTKAKTRRSNNGIIPAHAGNTCGVTRRLSRHVDHPRACGEHRFDLLVIDDMAGIIPAHAGNTLMPLFVLSRGRDHPRACGEHRLGKIFAITLMGSSPRMRGTLYRKLDVDSFTGIIPAHAGNTNAILACLRMDGDHPRACGEHKHPGLLKASGRGSSPRMRGTRSPAPAGRVQGGIIPAHAGNTSGSEQRECTRRDHPRACGEHRGDDMTNGTTPGSSPRMRGTHTTVCERGQEFGIIPAHAGNTWRGTGVRLRRWDHPRACGEHSRYRRAATIPAGSSPRMRGTLQAGSSSKG